MDYGNKRRFTVCHRELAVKRGSRFREEDISKYKEMWLFHFVFRGTVTSTAFECSASIDVMY
jgi:hypothetical protein